MATTKKFDPIAAARERQFQHERTVKFMINFVGYTVSICAGAILLMMLRGPRFDPILNTIGLHSIWTEKGGVYADCSLRENRDNRFCSGKAQSHTRSWKQIEGRSLPFNLSDD